MSHLLELGSTPNPHSDGTWLYPREKKVQIERPKYPLKVSVIDGISSLGKSRLIYFDGTVNSKSFTQLLLPIMRDLKPLHNNRPLKIVMDSASVHRSKFTNTWLTNHNIKYIPKNVWPASSPDLNPIENVWSTLQARVADSSPSTLTKLKQKVTMVWNAISQFRAIIAAKGAQNEY